MTDTITLIGDDIAIQVDDQDFYTRMLTAITDHVFTLLGPEFDKAGYLDEVSGQSPAAALGQELAIPVSLLLSLNLGYCLGQLKMIGRAVDCDKALRDVYDLWRAKLDAMLQQERSKGSDAH